MTVSVAVKLRNDFRGRWFESDVEQLLSTAVDDLVKYKIVRFLHEHPKAGGDAGFFASALGFHSVPKTAIALEELTASGILRQRLVPSTDEATYYLTSDQAVHERLERLGNVPPQSAFYGEMMRRLSAASLRRAEAAARRRPSSGIAQSADLV